MKYIAVILYRKWRGQKTRPSPTYKVEGHVPPSPWICARDDNEWAMRYILLDSEEPL